MGLRGVAARVSLSERRCSKLRFWPVPTLRERLRGDAPSAREGFRSQLWMSEMAQEDGGLLPLFLSRGELVTEFGCRQPLHDRFQKGVTVNSSLTV
jgi:hypothetical protein